MLILGRNVLQVGRGTLTLTNKIAPSQKRVGAYIVSSLRWSKIYNTVEFEPSATLLESEKKGHVVASLGKDSGYVPYTAFCAKKSYIKENKKMLQGFTNALQKGMDYVQSHTPEEIAKIIKPQFKDADMETITTIVERYAEQ